MLLEKVIEKSGNRKTLLLKKTDQHRTRVGAPGQLGMLVLAEGNPKDLNYFRSKIKGLKTNCILPTEAFNWEKSTTV